MLLQTGSHHWLMPVQSYNQSFGTNHKVFVGVDREEKRRQRRMTRQPAESRRTSEHATRQLS